MGERIALGLGDNIDYEIVWDSRVVEGLVAAHGIRASEINGSRPIHSERDLLISILSFVRSGEGGERFVDAPEVVDQFARRFDHKISLGGTSVRSAIAMRKLGYTSALHLVTINDHVRRLIPQDSPWVCSAQEDGLFPHLIVQFGKGCRVRAGDIDLFAERPNRIIYHHDDQNIVMELNEAFAGLITEARVFLISGFNAMHDEALLVDRLQTLLHIMESLPPEAQVFYEDAGFYNPAFSELILATLADRISIYSLNEDELQAHVGRKVNLLDATQVRDALADLHRKIPVPLIVVHSSQWALAYGEGAPRFARALKGGVTMATTRFRHGDDFTVADYRRVEALPANEAGAGFAAAISALLGEVVCCVPVVRVDQSEATTIGLGDAFVGGFLPALVDDAGS